MATEAQILALGVQSGDIFAKASDTGNFYHIPAGGDGGDAVQIVDEAALAAETAAREADLSALLASLNTGTIPVVSGTITITSPVTNSACQHNRNVTISGSYTVATGTLSHIQYRFAGGDWKLLTSTPAAGAFSGSVRIEPGVGTLEVRLNNSASTGSITGFLSGNIFVILGQSNANGSGLNSQLYTGERGSKMYRGGAWANTADPVGATSTGGSPYPLLATMLEERTGIPVAYVVGQTDGGTGLVAPPGQWAAPSGNNYNLSVTAINNSGINSAAAILWYQGERDALISVYSAAYATALSAMLDGFQSSCPALAGVKLIAALTGTSATAGGLSIDKQRKGTLLAISADADILPGPLAHAVFNPSDNLHWYTDVELLRLARMWCRSIVGNITGGESPKGASIVSKVVGTGSPYTAAQVAVVFDRELAPSTSTTGWEIVDKGGVVTISSVSIVGDTAVFTCARDLAGLVTLSYGKGETAATSTLTDIGQVARLPIAPLYSLAVGTGVGSVTSSLKTGLIAWWKMDETTGNRVDSHTNAIPLTVSGTVGFATGKISNGATIAAASNTGGKLTTADTAAMDFTNGFSISLWLKLSSANNLVVVFQKTAEVNVQISSGVIVASLLSSASAQTGIAASDQTALYDNNFHHVVISIPASEVRDGDIWVDGVKVANGTTYRAPGYSGWVDTANAINIGTVSNGGDATKTFDEYALWGRRVTEEEVAMLYNGGTGITYPT